MGSSSGPDTEGLKTVVKSVTSNRNDGTDNNPINNSCSSNGNNDIHSSKDNNDSHTSSSSSDNNKINLKRKATSQPVPHPPPPAPVKAPRPFPKYVDRNVRYKYLGTLGAGTYAAVYKVERLQEGGLFAIKTTSLENLDRVRLLNKMHFNGVFQTEVITLRQFPHTNIIAYISHFHYRDLLHMVLELASHVGHVCFNEMKSLHDAIVHRRIDKTTFLEYTMMMAAGVAHLHRNSILHGDIKPANILITEQNVVKLADLGEVRYMSE
ncbi:Cell division control protein 2 [Linnemannia hyalina]|uniref:Cell division control protein 2 n=1 Tax=Linnemannia hyalina TaxID=64524 RepID=A0A9P8BY94_9FUNG|nr:Cell division control protein 2 [Linnemannia hyalina]